MPKSEDTSLGRNYCKCSNYLYSETTKRIKVAKGNQTTYFFKSQELEIRCSKCNEIIIIKTDKCMD